MPRAAQSEPWPQGRRPGSTRTWLRCAMERLTPTCGLSRWLGWRTTPWVTPHSGGRSVLSGRGAAVDRLGRRCFARLSTAQLSARRIGFQAARHRFPKGLLDGLKGWHVWGKVQLHERCRVIVIQRAKHVLAHLFHDLFLHRLDVRQSEERSKLLWRGVYLDSYLHSRAPCSLVAAVTKASAFSHREQWLGDTARFLMSDTT